MIAYNGVSHGYSINDYNGYAGHFGKSVIDNLKRNKDVMAVEPDRVWSLPDPSLEKHNESDIDHVSQSKAQKFLAIIDGYLWVVKDDVQIRRYFKTIINMSLSDEHSLAFNTATNTAFAFSVTTVVAAGEEDKNVKVCSPGSAMGAVTVAAIDRNYKRASFSNLGQDVTIFAPGVKILSADSGAYGNQTVAF
ncbi:subtilisin-like protein [Myriangium duriaei CBS 260.36]|uniref:Subtilisin-like protein n=1 Tax=Myriangium duriaei CBS 260.36 TaxID=1168546 RepID=A0A9P4J6L1_9PEZI|nr:subtilisin-like protein [Myriangium duriaei CBS 260.36]